MYMCVALAIVHNIFDGRVCIIYLFFFFMYKGFATHLFSRSYDLNGVCIIWIGYK